MNLVLQIKFALLVLAMLLIAVALPQCTDRERLSTLTRLQQHGENQVTEIVVAYSKGKTSLEVTLENNDEFFRLLKEVKVTRSYSALFTPKNTITLRHPGGEVYLHTSTKNPRTMAIGRGKVWYDLQDAEFTMGLRRLIETQVGESGITFW